MNTDTLLDRLRVANPTPESDRLDIDDTALLVAIDGRSASMTYQAERRATKRLPTFHDQEPPRNRKPVLVAAAAFTVVVAVGVAAALVAAGSEDRSPATTPQTTTPTTPLLSSLTWSRVPHDDAVFGDKVPFTDGMRDVAAGGPGLVAVGEGDDGIAVWTSVDGITWSRAPHDKAVFGGANTMWSVTTGGPGLVAVGGGKGPEHQRDDGEATVWTSVDGIAWSRVRHDETIFGGEGQQQMVSVTAGGPNLVAVGWDTSDAAVWTSVDGITWSRVPHDEAVFGGQGEQQMHSVTVGGPGLVAVGSDGFLETDRGQLTDYDDFTGVAAVWTSVDGLTWSRVPADEAVFGGEHDQLMLSVTPAGSGLVAVGRAWAPAGDSLFIDDSAASVWTSDDGITWFWIGYDEAVLGSEDNSPFLLSDGPVFTEYRQFMSGVAATSSGVVAVGADWSGPSHGAAVWMALPED